MYSGMNPDNADNTAQTAMNDNAQAGTQNMQADAAAMNQDVMGAAAAQNPYYQNTGATAQAMGTQQSATMQNPYYTQAPNPALAQQSSTMDLIMGTTTNERLVRGLILGAAAAYLLTNENAQKAVIKTGMKLYGAVAGGVEEFKEKVMDVKAEMEAEAMQQESDS